MSEIEDLRWEIAAINSELSNYRAQIERLKKEKAELKAGLAVLKLALGIASKMGEANDADRGSVLAPGPEGPGRDPA